MNNEIEKLQKRKEQLEKSVEFTKQKKKEIVKIVQDLISQINSGRIGREEYEDESKRALGKKHIAELKKRFNISADFFLK